MHKVRFLKDYRCFKDNEVFCFYSGVNLLVGKRGAGKSTLLERIKKDSAIDNFQDKITSVITSLLRTRMFDFERSNLKLNEVIKEILRSRNTLLLIDEPNVPTGGCHELVNAMKTSINKGCQIIAAVRNPALIYSFENVLDLDRRCWLPSRKFVESQKP